jgi:hypothetical protein
MGWPLDFKVLDDSLWATSYRTASKVARIEAADQAACVLFNQEHDPYPYAVLEGTVQVVVPTVDLVGRYMGWTAGELPAPLPRVADRLLQGKRVFLRFRSVRLPVLLSGDS